MRDLIEAWVGHPTYWPKYIVDIIRDIEKYIKDNRGKDPEFHYPGASKYVGWILQYSMDNNINARTQPDYHKIRQYFEYKYRKIGR